MLKCSLGGGIERVEMEHRYDPVRVHVCADRWIDLFRRKYDAVFCSGGCYSHDLSKQCCTSITQ